MGTQSEYFKPEEDEEPITSIPQALAQLSPLMNKFGTRRDWRAFGFLGREFNNLYQLTSSIGEKQVTIGNMPFKMIISPYVPEGWIVVGSRAYNLFDEHRDLTVMEDDYGTKK